MIRLTRFNHKVFYLNCDLIELVEETPDTLITMTTGKKYLVDESAEDVLEKIIHFRNQCFRDLTLKIKRDDDENKDMSNRHREGTPDSSKEGFK